MTPAPSIAEFVARFPEFDEIPPEYAGLVQLALDEAARNTNGDVFQTPQLAADAAMFKAAVLLCNSPYARKMRLADLSGARYEVELYKKQRAATMGIRVF